MLESVVNESLCERICIFSIGNMEQLKSPSRIIVSDLIHTFSKIYILSRKLGHSNSDLISTPQMDCSTLSSSILFKILQTFK